MRDQFCRVVLVGFDGSDTRQSMWGEEIEVPYLDSLREAAAGDVADTLAENQAGQRIPPGLYGRARDGALVGWMENRIYSAMDFSCFDGEVYEPDGPGWRCFGLYRWRDRAGSGRPPILVPTSPRPSGVVLEYLVSRLGTTDSALAREVDDRTRALGGGGPGVDSSYIQFLVRLRAFAESAQGTRAVAGYGLLDVFIERGLDAMLLGNPGVYDSSDNAGTILRGLGVAPSWEELGGSWGYEHDYLRRAERLGVTGELKDSIYSWLRRGETACTHASGHDFAERVSGQRRYTVATSRELAFEANEAMAQLWSDSLRDARGREAAAVLDSARAALERAYQLTADATARQRLRRAIWYAAGGLPPLPVRQSCHIND